MADITVRRLGANEWEEYKGVRLRGLQESPDAFVAAYETEVMYDDQLWRDRMLRSERLVAEVNGEAVGVVSVRHATELFDNAAELFGLWVTPSLRGTGVAARLVVAASQEATQMGHRQLVYWVGTDNGRAVAFASSYGFRPTEHRRPLEAPGDENEQELAMVLALG